MAGDTTFVFAIVAIAAILFASGRIRLEVVAMLVEPGRYRFVDFVKVGTPLMLLSYLVIIAVAPIIFPL